MDQDIIDAIGDFDALELTVIYGEAPDDVLAALGDGVSTAGELTTHLGDDAWLWAALGL